MSDARQLLHAFSHARFSNKAACDKPLKTQLQSIQQLPGETGYQLNSHIRPRPWHVVFGGVFSALGVLTAGGLARIQLAPRPLDLGTSSRPYGRFEKCYMVYSYRARNPFMCNNLQYNLEANPRSFRLFARLSGTVFLSGQFAPFEKD